MLGAAIVWPPSSAKHSGTPAIHDAFGNAINVDNGHLVIVYNCYV
jgi:hypothetical protein